MLSWSPAVTVAVLMALIPEGFRIPTLALSGAAGLVMVCLVVWETMTYQGRVHLPRRSAD